MKLKQAALDFARKRWADYILVRDKITFVPSLLLIIPSKNELVSLRRRNDCGHSPILPLSRLVSVRRRRQHPHQPRNPQPDDGREQVGHRPHAGLSGGVLQLLVRHHSTGERGADSDASSFTRDNPLGWRTLAASKNDTFLHFLTPSLSHTQGLLPPNGRVFPNASSPQAGLLPRAHDPLHRAVGFTEGGHEETGLLPASQGLLVALRRHHRVRLLLPRRRSVRAPSRLLGGN